jgi:hypothetical protein
MKLQYKVAGLMILVGIFSLFFIKIVYSNLINKTVLQEELQNIGNLTEEIANHMNSHLVSNYEKIILKIKMIIFINGETCGAE